MTSRIPLFVMFMLGACGPKQAAPPPPPPDDDPPLEVVPIADAGAAPVDEPAGDPIDAGAAPAGARVWLEPAEVDWPTDRSKAQFVALGGGRRSMAFAVSGDGSTPAGWAAVGARGHTEAVRWRNGTLEPLRVPGATAGTESEALALSFDGRVVAGKTRETTPGGSTDAMMWAEGSEPRRLARPEGLTTAWITGLTRDGTVGFGCGSAEGACEVPLRWIGNHVAPLDGPRPFEIAAHPVTTDGRVVVGRAGDKAARLEKGRALLKDPDSQAHSISDDGKVIVGRKGDRAVLWRGAKATDLGMLPGHDRCQARAVSTDGGRVVGSCTTPRGELTAWVWDLRHGMRSVADALAAAGVRTVGWSLSDASDICSYGVTLVGSGGGPGAPVEAWMAILPR